MSEFKKEYILVGGSHGISEELVLELLKNPENHVHCFCREKPSTTHESLSWKQFDVTKQKEKTNVFKERLCEPQNLAGFCYFPGSISLKPFSSFKEADFLTAFQINLLGAHYCLQEVVPLLKKSEIGFAPGVLLFSTVAVQTGMPFHSLVASAKGALEAYGRSLAAELAPRVRVNIIAPSLTQTPLAKENVMKSDALAQSIAEKHPMKRLGSARELAQTAHFLLSERSAWVTGQVLHVDGGMSCLKV